VDDSYIRFRSPTIMGGHKKGVDTNLKVICVDLLVFIYKEDTTRVTLRGLASVAGFFDCTTLA